jgi:hypothetical protein
MIYRVSVSSEVRVIWGIVTETNVENNMHAMEVLKWYPPEIDLRSRKQPIPIAVSINFPVRAPIVKDNTSMKRKSSSIMMP